MWNDETNLTIGKIGGPLILFIGTPWAIWMAYSVITKDLSAGVTVSVKDIAGIVVGILFIAWTGLYACQKSLGWFGGRKN